MIDILTPSIAMLSGLSSPSGAPIPSTISGLSAEWVSALATVGAVIVAAFALRYSSSANRASTQANELAQRVYADDVRARNEAQARLVYADIVNTWMYRKGQTIPRPERDHVMTQVGGNVLGIPAEPGAEPSALEDLQIIDLEIVNGGSEVIGSFQAQLFDVPNQKLIPGSVGSNYVLPGERSGLIRIAVPGIAAHYEPEIFFRDSAGLYWSRRGFEPVQSLDQERRDLFARMVQLGTNNPH